MNKRKGKGNPPKERKLINYKDLERNVLNEIAKEFQDKTPKKGK
ncbi:MAG: hypothetical protein PHT03_05400 [Bacilli bacterium]|nr:hypothetical protein [Bacilli bacterium]